MLRITDTQTNEIVELEETSIKELLHALNWARKEKERCRIKDKKRNTGKPCGRPPGWKKGVDFCKKEEDKV